MNRKKNFTSVFIESAAPGTYTDSGCRGLKLRVANNGYRSFYHQWQLRGAGELGRRGKATRGPIRKAGIGQYPTVTLAEARLRVTQQRVDFVDRGESPVVIEPVGEAVPGGKTFAEVAGMALGDTENTTTRHDLRDHLLPLLGRRPIREITRREVATVLDQVSEGVAVSRGERVLGHLKKIFELAFERGYSDDNPTAGMKRRYKSERRDRTLNLDELRELWGACDNHGCGAAVRLLMLTGQRRREVGRMKWDDLDLDAMVWTSRWQNLKGGTAERGDHTVFLSRQAVDLLRSIPRGDGPFIFSVKNGSSPVTGWKPYKEKLDRALPDLPPWVVHSLRHTVVSGLADKLGVAPHVVSRVVGHTLGKSVSGVTAGYMHVDLEAERRAAMQRWGDHLFPRADDSVVRLVS